MGRVGGGVEDPDIDKYLSVVGLFQHPISWSLHEDG